MAEASNNNNNNGLASAASWFKNNPLWLAVLLFAGIGTPTSIGTVIWSQNSETRMALMTASMVQLNERFTDNQAIFKASMAELRAEVMLRPSIKEIAEIQRAVNELEKALESRVTRPERMEMLTNLERTDQDLYRRIDRLQELIYQQSRPAPLPMPPTTPYGR